MNHHLEEINARQLHWFVGLLHLIELVLKNIFRKVFGSTTFSSWKHPIDLEIMADGFHKWDIVKFEPIFSRQSETRQSDRFEQRSGSI